MIILKYLFAVILFVHGLIHFMGFAKAFEYGSNTREWYIIFIAPLIRRTSVGFLWLHQKIWGGVN